MFAVVVTFQIKAGRLADFMPLMLSNARNSLRLECGCIQFDVGTDAVRPDEVFLYELYKDRAAFEAHLATKHFRIFDAEISGMVAAKDLRTYERVQQ
jgi:quinol monooxygenase YgiN